MYNISRTMHCAMQLQLLCVAKESITVETTTDSNDINMYFSAIPA
jgi:hypothetical protein